MEVEPVYGEGFFHVSMGTIYYTIIYEYRELDDEAHRAARNPSMRRREEEGIAREMQRLMDAEKILVNGERVRCVVDLVRLEPRPERRHAAVIHSRIDYKPLPGKNVYEDFYEPEVAPYDYTVYWVAPPGGSIVDVDTPGALRYGADRRIAIIHVRRGTRLNGYEAVVFRLPESWTTS
ncbi:MAG: hypothetical protein F7C35_06045 [Desulfurococcales archaeon]|nr:hypothetical protein [Desulfurococcales archaeon]